MRNETYIKPAIYVNKKVIAAIPILFGMIDAQLGSIHFILDTRNWIIVGSKRTSNNFIL